jgi:3',5'-cyclic AMP phosphodiesterase CpdA
LLENLLAALDDARPDHLAITGDLTNLSLGVEFAELRLLLDRLAMGPDQVTVVPGNHDRYTGGAERANRIRAYLEPYMRGDVADDGSFPLVRIREGVAIIGLDTATSQPPFIAAGRVGTDQLVRLEDLLGRDRIRESYPVLLMHHPPYDWTSNRLLLHMNGLRDRTRLVQLLGDRSALLLYGHLHRNGYYRRSTNGSSMTLVGVASATRHGRVRPHLQSTFHVFEVDRDGLHRVQRYTLHDAGPGYTVTDVASDEFIRLDEDCKPIAVESA